MFTILNFSKIQQKCYLLNQAIIHFSWVMNILQFFYCVFCFISFYHFGCVVVFNDQIIIQVVTMLS